MTRGSGNTYGKLIDAGKKLISETGFSGFSIRRLTREAGVNLGMFHYHFGTKKNFTRRLLEYLYEDFFARFELKAVSGKDSMEKLRNALTEFAFFARDNGDIFLLLIKDALNGCRPSSDFIYENAPRHLKIIFNLVRQCQKERRIVGMPAGRVLSFIAGAVAAPSLMAYAAKRISFNMRGKGKISGLDSFLLSDEAVRGRVEMALSALETLKTGKRK